ncbi:MAG: hypothetical protein NZT92_08745 [Abditibacteriales bacterium]|nr:hypothetical protein [Abditibacteriales bacterium]
MGKGERHNGNRVTLVVYRVNPEVLEVAAIVYEARLLTELEQIT